MDIGRSRSTPNSNLVELFGTANVINGMRLCGFAFSLLLLATTAGSVRAASFIDSLSPSDKVASGIVHLSSLQQAALNTFAVRDITLAREGAVTGFAGSFTDRRDDNQKKTAGLDTLTLKERGNLDALVATAISARPMTYQATTAAPAPAAPPAPSMVLTAPKLELHGDVSVFAGGGKGSSFYGTAFDVNVTDPSGKFSLAVGVSTVHSKGLPPCLFYGPYAGFP